MNLSAPFLFMIFFLATGLSLAMSETTVPAPYYFQSQEPHQITILEEGPSSFTARLNLIASAKKSISIEYFIFKPDRMGQLIVEALKKKAQEGVKIRILIDKSPLAPPLNADVSYLLSLYGIEVRYFNPITFLSLGRAFHRTHRKMLIVDGERVITGGRNIGEEYFLRNGKFSFIDRDILLEGPVVAGMLESFDAYWEHELSQKPKLKKYHRRHKATDLRHKRLRRAWNFFTDLNSAKKLLSEIELQAQDYFNYAKAQECRHLEFTSDGPSPIKETRYFAPYFYSLLEKSEHSLQLQTPYFITLKRDRKLLEGLLKRGISLELITNSTNSNNHPIVSNVLNRKIDNWVRKGMDAYFMTGAQPACYYCPEEAQGLLPAPTGLTYGLHSKSALIDKQKSLFITFNLDPQSQVRSLEMGVVCHDGPELAQQLSDLFESHKTVSFTFDNKGRPEGKGGLLRGTTAWEKISYFLRIFPSILFAPLL